MITEEKIKNAAHKWAIDSNKKYPHLCTPDFIAGANWALNTLDPICDLAAKVIEKNKDMAREIRAWDIQKKIETGSFCLPENIRAQIQSFLNEGDYEELSTTSFEDYDKINIFCSVYFASFGPAETPWKFMVSWYNKENQIVNSNFGEASTRLEATEKALELAKEINERGYNNKLFTTP